MKLIIAGSRSFKDYNLLKSTIDNYISNIDKRELEIVSGCALGADKLGEKYALENNIEVVKFPANWDKYGKQAGYLRNLQMAEFATDCIVFRVDGIKSKGSTHMINIAKNNKLNLVIVEINSDQLKSGMGDIIAISEEYNLYDV